MGLLEGKKGLIVGLSSDRAIAWGIAQALLYLLLFFFFRSASEKEKQIKR